MNGSKSEPINLYFSPIMWRQPKLISLTPCFSKVFAAVVGRRNCFNSFLRARVTVETVRTLALAAATPLKRGVNEKNRPLKKSN
jgi:hypothetical protein